MNYSLLWKPRKLMNAVSARVTQRRRMIQAIRRGEDRFRNSPNYRCELVPTYFAERPGLAKDDSILLKRIANAYNKAKAAQRDAGEAFNVSNEWLPIYERNLGPVMNALSTANIGELDRMYGNFFRDSCSSGLVGLPINMPKAFLGGSIRKRYRKYLLCDALHRHDLWKQRTENACGIGVLEAPLVGNPYGSIIDGVFVRGGADYQHYYAQTIAKLAKSSKKRVVFELGGGFGGLAYFLMRDNPDFVYVDCDLPEALALASYYLIKSLPDVPVRLFGEEGGISGSNPAAPGIHMIPSFEIMGIPPDFAGVSFNSYSLSEMSPATIHTYLDRIAEITAGYILHVNHNRDAVLSADKFRIEDRGFQLIRRELAGWTLGINPESDEMEYLYERNEA